MKTSLILTAAAVLLWATPASAQDDRHHEHGGPPTGHQAAPHAPAGPAAHGPAGPPPGRMRGGPAMSGLAPHNMMREQHIHGPAMNGPAPQNNRMREQHMRGGPAMSGPAPHNMMREQHIHGPAMNGPAPQNNMMRNRGAGPANNPAPSGAMRGQGGGHARIDLHAYQRNFAAPRHFHIGRYRAPHGYYYRRWSYGERLPDIYFDRDYWILDFGDYGLMPPPYGYVWVRYGPDALLIDEYSGEIVQVEYGVFY